MRTTDVAVIGAGPAGIGAALAAAQNGARVTVIDENDAPGGHLRWTLARQTGFDAPLDNLRGNEIADWSSGALDEAGVEVLTTAVAWGVFEGNTLGIASADASYQLQAGSIIVASGATDVTWPFPGWELPGVMTATAAQRLMHLDRVLPGARVVVLGAGMVADNVATDLSACGAHSVFRVPSAEGVSVGGVGVVEWFVADGQRSACDAIVLAFGRQPDAQLALQAQAAVEFSAIDGSFVPVRDQNMTTIVSNLYVAGDAAGIGSPARSFADGAVAGAAASGGAGLESARDRLHQFGVASGSSLPMPAIDGATLVCRCEDVSADQIRAAIAAGAASLNDLKRRTRAGMGICQGVFCHRAVAGMLAAEAGIALDAIAPMTARPPARLISMAAMADLDG